MHGEFRFVGCLLYCFRVHCRGTLCFIFKGGLLCVHFTNIKCGSQPRAAYNRVNAVNFFSVCSSINRCSLLWIAWHPIRTGMWPPAEEKTKYQSDTRCLLLLPRSTFSTSTSMKPEERRIFGRFAVRPCCCTRSLWRNLLAGRSNLSIIMHPPTTWLCCLVL